MKNLEMLRFAPDHFKTKEMPKNAANAANAAICNKVCCWSMWDPRNVW